MFRYLCLARLYMLSNFVSFYYPVKTCLVPAILVFCFLVIFIYFHLVIYFLFNFSLSVPNFSTFYFYFFVLFFCCAGIHEKHLQFSFRCVLRMSDFEFLEKWKMENNLEWTVSVFKLLLVTSSRQHFRSLGIE